MHRIYICTLEYLKASLTVNEFFHMRAQVATAVWCDSVTVLGPVETEVIVRKTANVLQQGRLS